MVSLNSTVLDVILPQLARQRVVMASLRPEKNVVLAIPSLKCSIYLRGALRVSNESVRSMVANSLLLFDAMCALQSLAMNFP